MLASIRITACLFQQILVQCSVTLALSVTQLPAAPISSDRRVPRTEIPSVQLIVVPRSVNIATSPEMSWTALFEGVLTAQVKKKKEATKCLRRFSINSSISLFVIRANLLYP